MKGIVFTEFLQFVEETAGADVVDDMIEISSVPSGGAYTAIGKYDYTEMVALVGALSGILDKPAPALVQAYGRHLFGRFGQVYPQFFAGASTTLDFIEQVQDRIHTEVLKLYPDAELPGLDAERTPEGDLVLVYTSCRPFGSLCIGLIEGCAEYFGETVEVAHTPRPDGLVIKISCAAAQAA